MIIKLGVSLLVLWTILGMYHAYPEHERFSLSPNKSHNYDEAAKNLCNNTKLKFLCRLSKAGRYRRQVTSTGPSLPTNLSTSQPTFHNMEISKTFQLLKEGEEKIQLSDQYKNITLVLGNTGAGKTTFLQWFAGDNDKLIAKEVREGTGEYIIEDGNRIGSATITSKTIFPELVIHIETNTAYYDCPGFSDTRSTSIDIAITYFIKKVADHAERIKMVFVVSYPSVRKGVDRQDFIRLLRHATDFVKYIEKYQQSIAMMVTKVDNQYVKSGRSFNLVPDEKVIDAIGDFLEEVKQGLVERLGSESISGKEKVFCANAIKFLDTLLIKDGENYARIGLLRRPDEPGSLSNNTLLQEGKEPIDRILNKNLAYTLKDNIDFGYTISDNSKHDINDLVDGINNNIWSNLQTIVVKIKQHYHYMVEVIQNKINSFATSTESVVADPSEAQKFVDSVNIGFNITKQLIDEVKNVTVDKLAENIRHSIALLGIDGCEDDVLSVSNQGKYFEFIRVVSNKVLSPKPWGILLQSIETYLSDSMHSVQYDINDVIEKINNKIDANINSISKKIKEHYHQLVLVMRSKVSSFVTSTESVDADLYEAQHFVDGFNAAFNITKKLIEEVKNVTVDKLAENIRHRIALLGIDGCEDDVLSVSNQGKYFEFLRVVSNKVLSPKPWGTLMQSIETNLSYSKHDIQQDINVVSEKINNQINTNINSITEKIMEHYQSEMHSMDIARLPDELDKRYNFIWKISEEIERLSIVQALSRKLKVIISDIDIFKKISRNTHNIFNLGKYLAFLQVISIKSLYIQLSKWSTPFKKTATYLNESQRWYLFLNDLYNKLSTYEIQKDKSKYNVANIEHWGQGGKSQGISITLHNFRQFLKKVKLFHIAEYDAVENMEVALPQLNELNEVLDLTVRRNTDASCDSNELLIKGDYIKFSDLVDTNGNLKKLCEIETQSVNLFALHTLFIDEDLKGVGNKLKVTAIAPKWEVIGRREINLSGSHGKPHNSPKADNGRHTGSNGTDGKPGLPGGSAGSFFGVGAKVFNGHNLTVMAIGGNGGPGQDGGDGRNGSDGRNAPSKNPEHYRKKYWCQSACRYGEIDGFKCSSTPVDIIACDSCYAGKLLIIKIKLNIIGTNGINGGYGGNGGKRGNNGKSGDIRLISLLGENLGISYVNNVVNTGISGRGGIGAVGGKHRDSVEITCDMYYYPIFELWSFVTSTDNGYASSGSNGTTGANGANIQSPEPAAVINYKAKIINDYKSYLRENLPVSGRRFRRNTLLMLSNQLDSNSEVTDIYDTSGLFDELQGLEKQFNLLHKEELVLFYQSLLHRIRAYAENPKTDEKSIEHKKTLGYLYTATLSKLNDLRTDSDTTLIIDVDGYLDLVNKNIKDLAELQEKSNKATILNDYKNKYKDQIDTKIVEANRFIKEEITPFIDQLNIQIDAKIDQLINETIELQKSAENNQNELLEKKKSIRK